MPRCRNRSLPRFPTGIHRCKMPFTEVMKSAQRAPEGDIRAILSESPASTVENALIRLIRRAALRRDMGATVLLPRLTVDCASRSVVETSGSLRRVPAARGIGGGHVSCEAY